MCPFCFCLRCILYCIAFLLLREAFLRMRITSIKIICGGGQLPTLPLPPLEPPLIMHDQSLYLCCACARVAWANNLHRVMAITHEIRPFPPTSKSKQNLPAFYRILCQDLGPIQSLVILGSQIGRQLVKSNYPHMDPEWIIAFIWSIGSAYQIMIAWTAVISYLCI